MGPAILDLSTQGPFNTNAPPTGWTDCGWIKNFKLTPGSKIGQVRSGYRGAVRAQYRGEVGESFEFSFREAARMQFKIAVGNTPFNLISNETPTTLGPLSATGAPKTAMVSYQASPPQLTVTNAVTIGVSAGSYIVCDLDYTAANFPGQGNPPYGIVGAAGVPIQPNAVTDVDYIRKTSDFVARVTSTTGTTILNLDQAFIGGGSGTPTAYATPPTGSNVQAISGWAVREGATFITEWSGLFVMDTIDAAQIAIYYPHISIAQFKDIQAWAIENVGTTDETGYDLDCMMNALAFDDPLDGETVVGYKAFYCRPSQNIAI